MFNDANYVFRIHALSYEFRRLRCRGRVAITVLIQLWPAPRVDSGTFGHSSSIRRHHRHRSPRQARLPAVQLRSPTGLSLRSGTFQVIALPKRPFDRRQTSRNPGRVCQPGDAHPTAAAHPTHRRRPGPIPVRSTTPATPGNFFEGSAHAPAPSNGLLLVYGG